MPKTYKARIDGEKCRTIKEFLKEVSLAFEFPDYFGNNFNALWDCLTDLQWISASRYEMIVDNSELLLIDESLKDRNDLIDLLFRVSSNWDSIPNYPGEEEFRERASFRIFLN